VKSVTDKDVNINERANGVLIMSVAYHSTVQDAVQLRHDPHVCQGKTISQCGPPHIQSAMDLEHAIARAICERTSGRVRLLQVRLLGSRVVLRGWTTSYHAVQLALAGLFETLGAMNLDRPEDVELDIDVLPAGPLESVATLPRMPR
jgi:hypothetical protein